jgi:hypothetical protein
MNISVAADLADLLAALGIIATVIFLALQIRQNTKAVKNTRWESYLDRLANSFVRPMDERIAAVILKGNQSFNTLSDTEKLVYSAWADEYVLSVALLLTYRDQAVLGSITTDTADRRLAWFFGVPGSLEWWRHNRRHPVPQHVETRINRWIEAHLN